jgi:glycosyltransferase involved in cell wall biosynthesis
MSIPEITIIVPTRSRPSQLKSCLEGIVNLEPSGPSFEVVVVDDGSAQSPEPIIESFRRLLSIHLIIQSGHFGPAAARNAGALSARGRFLVFIDDDCIPACGWLSTLARELRRHPDWLLGGYVENGLPANPYATASQHIATYAQRYYQNERGNEQFFGTNNFALSSDRFRELAGFDSSIPSYTAEDKEFCDRWRARDYQMSFVPDAVVYHAHHLNLWRFVCQHFHYGRGILVFRLMRRRRGFSRLMPERFAFYRKLILYPAGVARESRAAQQTALMIVSQLATLFGALWAALLERPKPAPRPLDPRESFADRSPIG